MVFVNSDSGERFLSWGDVNGDRNDLLTQKGGDKLVRAVASNCGGATPDGPASNTVVSLDTLGPTILEDWIDLSGVKSVLIAHLPGQESGNALANVILGDVNPSGCLPYTIAKREDDYGPDSKILTFPNAPVPQQTFTEGLYVHYRFFDKNNITPRYEFGYGLSYTSFHLSSLLVNPRGLHSGEPQSRPPSVEPPQVNETIPRAHTALWPDGFRRLENYIYPYIDKEPCSPKEGSNTFPRRLQHFKTAIASWRR